MKFKELLEKMEDNSEVYADLVMRTVSSSGFRHKVFIAWASDFLADKIWLDKEVTKIYNEQIDDYACRISVALQEPKNETFKN